MTRTTCPYCGVGCGVVHEAGRVTGDAAHPANRGELCAKGAALAATLELPGRIMHPLLRGVRVDWNTALEHIVGTFARIREESGPEAIGFYVSGQFLTEDYYAANKLMKGYLGAANIDTNSRLCMASSVAGHVRAFGEDVVPGSYEDFDVADCVVLVGSNAAWCHPVLHRRLLATRARRGTTIVVIDPRRTATAAEADLHLAIAPGTDTVLFAGLLVFLADHHALDRAWVTAHVAGAEEAIAAARAMAPDIAAVARASGLDHNDIEIFYRRFAATPRSVTAYSQGVNQSLAGTDKVGAIINVHLATGRIGKPGMGPFSLTGQPNAMGGREVGGLANQLAAHMGFTADAVDRVRRFWDAPAMATRPGHKAVEMFEAAARGEIRALWIAGTNPADSMPRAGAVRAALRRCEFVVVADAWATDTTALADLVLPAATWGEKSGTVTNSERCISRQRGFRAAPGEAMPDWWMFAEIGRRMGHRGAFGWNGPADIFREHAALTAFENGGARRLDLGALAGLDDAAYDALTPVQWPCPAAGQAGGQPGGRLFADGGFTTPDGRARMVALAPPALPADAARPLILNTGRVRDQWHTMTRTGAVVSLMAHSPAPVLAIHPHDADAAGIAADGLVRVETASGSTVLRCLSDPRQRQGEIFLPMHWTDAFTSAGPAGALVHALVDPHSGQPDLKRTPARVVPVAEAWRGRLLRRRAGTLPPGLVWSRAPVAGGDAYAMAGTAPLGRLIASEAALRALLGVDTAAEIVSHADAALGLYRFAAFAGEVLEAAAFFGPPGHTLAEAALAESRLGQTVQNRFGLLAGSGAAPAGRIVCACHAVGEAAIGAAIAGGASSVEAIGAVTRAGTNCGACVPELRGMLKAAPCARQGSNLRPSRYERPALTN